MPRPQKGEAMSGYGPGLDLLMALSCLPQNIWQSRDLLLEVPMAQERSWHIRPGTGCEAPAPLWRSEEPGNIPLHTAGHGH